MLHGLRQPKESGEYRHARFQVTRITMSFSGTVTLLLCVATLMLLWREPASAFSDRLTTVTFVEAPVPVSDVTPTTLQESANSLTDSSETPLSGADASESGLPSGDPDVAASDFAPTMDPSTPGTSGFAIYGTVTVPGLTGGLMKRGGSGNGGGGFGYTNGMSGDLVGTMYDLKRNGDGRSRTPSFTRDVRKIVESGFSQAALKNFYRVPKSIYLSHLFVPYAEAGTGPKSFGVEKLMQPSRWIIRYSGEISAPSAGQYRLAGDFDDLLLVLIDGKVVLEANWGDPVTKWKPRENVGVHKSFTSHALTYSDWIALAPNQKRHIDILVGEDPGGMVGGLLLVEKKDRHYEVDASGRPVLPIFAVQPLTQSETARLRSFDKWTFARHTPVMAPAKQQSSNGHDDDDDVAIRISNSK